MIEVKMQEEGIGKFRTVVMYHPVHGRKAILSGYRKLGAGTKAEAERICLLRCGTPLKFNWLS